MYRTWTTYGGVESTRGCRDYTVTSYYPSIYVVCYDKCN